MDSNQIRESFLSFFKEKGHKIIPSSSLIPDDPSVLLTTAGMQQFKKYFTDELDAEKDFGTKNVVSIQKCFRTSDIDEVGDESHLTFFEMLGNFSFGGYWKKEAIEYAYEFITKELGLKIDYVSVFEGDKDIPADIESEEIWKSLGIKNIKKFGRKDNFWGPTGNEGPCGPTTEIYINGIEIWNLVFNEYYCGKDKRLIPLKTKSVDTGMGLERLAMVVQKKPTIFETDLFLPIIQKIKSLSKKKDIRTERIIADHLRAAIFILGNNKAIMPSNIGQGYILRRLIRRVVRRAKSLGIEGIFSQEIIKVIIENYKDNYYELEKNKNFMIKQLAEEKKKFQKPLDWVEQYRIDLAEAVNHNIIKEIKNVPILLSPEVASGKYIYENYQTYGVPPDLSTKVIQEMGLQFNKEEFEEAFKKHQEISRAGVKKKFGGHGLVLDTGELKAGNEEEKQKVIRLHTATHLLHQALRDVLGSEVSQRGSDITLERTRFDFLFPRKMTSEEIKKVEDIVNKKIKENLTVNSEEILKEEAKKTGALHFFKGKYPDKVKIYYTGDSLESAYSKEFCGGPHVLNTGEIGKFKITKEESSSAGIRRIRAIIS